MFAIRGSIWSLVIAGLFASAACTKKETRHESVQPVKEIQGSFNVQQTPPSVSGELAVDKYLVGIRKSALEKEFLMRTEFIGQALVPAFQGLRSRIIAFRQHGSELLMLEATKGHVVDNSVPTTLLLAKFNIVKEVDDVLYFDLNQGFSNMYMTADWYGSDSPTGSAYDEAAAFQSVPFNMSYIDEARFDSQNQLVVSQVGQLRMNVTEGSMVNASVKAKFYFGVYTPDPNFAKVDMKNDFSQFGYFEVNPTLNDEGEQVTYATHFSIANPIVYAVSDATPAEFKNAVREGILYWNKAFGREMIKVVDAPKGSDAPNSEMNVVQWVNWDWAGAAYADAQMDPRTGQTMHAQVFMTSVFAIGGKAAARRLIRQLEAGTAAAKPATRISLKGFAASSTCNRTQERGFVETLSEIVADPAVQDADVLRAAQDYVRNVVAHEVGHTLGLRHNFSGSLHANFGPADQKKVMTEYFVNKTVDPNLIATSSVMDYDAFTEALVTGHQILALSKAMQYDEMAIRHLYDGVKYNRSEVPPFCTDSHIGVLVDCAIWDSGPSALESAVALTNKAWLDLPETLMKTFATAKGAGLPVERVAFDTKVLAQAVMDERMPILKSLEKDGSYLSINRQFDVVDSVNADSVRIKKQDYLKTEMDRLGGLAKVLAPFAESQVTLIQNKVDVMVDSGKYDKGIDENDNTFQFSTTEMAVIRQRSKEVVAKVYSALIERDQAVLTEWKAALPEHVLSDEYAEVLANRVQDWMLGTTGQMLTGNVTFKDGSTKAVSLPVYKYKFDIRKASFAMLQREGAPSADWAYLRTKGIVEALQKAIADGFGGKFVDVKTESLSREVLRWYLEMKELALAIDPTGSLLGGPPQARPAVQRRR